MISSPIKNCEKSPNEIHPVEFSPDLPSGSSILGTWAHRGDYVMSPAPKLCSFKLISTPRNIEYASDSVDMNDLQ